MSRYTVNHDYTAFADGVRYGPWKAREVVELDGSVAAWINRDSPGALDLVEQAKPQRSGRPGADRQHRGAKDR